MLLLILLMSSGFVEMAPRGNALLDSVCNLKLISSKVRQSRYTTSFTIHCTGHIGHILKVCFTHLSPLTFTSHNNYFRHTTTAINTHESNTILSILSLNCQQKTEKKDISLNTCQTPLRFSSCC